ncbi:hypothetical protein AB2F28_24165 (plasmid) [Escherichia coli]
MLDVRGLLALASSGELKARQDVRCIEALKLVLVVRTTKAASALPTRTKGRNIRLKGAIYEQSRNAGGLEAVKRSNRVPARC